MSPVKSIHREAMEFANLAFVAKAKGDAEKSQELFRKAFELERKAAEQLEGQIETEPSRSVLLRSAATLALDCGEYQEAERLAYLGLRGNPPSKIAAELREVLERAVVERLEAEGQVVRLEPEVAEVFDSSETVNHALRSLIEAMPKEKRKAG